MQSIYEIANGSVTGTDHVHADRGNQDARCVRQTPEFTVAVVADGCSDGAHSEVGAHVGARIAAEAIGFNTFMRPDIRKGLSWDAVHRDVARAISSLLDDMGGEDSEPETRRALINEFFLFTLVAIVVTPTLTEVATFGDGFASINGTALPTAKYDKNMPPYIAYGLTKSSIAADMLRWNVIAVIPTEYVDTFAIGTDGVDDLVANEQAIVPGRVTEIVGPLSQFHEDRYYRNADMMRRRLAIINGGVGANAQRGGLLHDDTTLVVGRRSACSR